MNNRDIAFHNGIVSYNEEKYDLAIDWFEKALLSPFSGGLNNDALILNNKAMALRSLKRYPEAYECLLDCYQLGLRNEIVVKHLKSLEIIIEKQTKIVNQINGVANALTLAYELKGWRVEVLHNLREENHANTTVRIFMGARQLGMFSHLFNFFTNDKGTLIDRIRISGDYNTVLQETKAVDKTREIFKLPIKEIKFHENNHDSAYSDFYLKDYSYLL